MRTTTFGPRKAVCENVHCDKPVAADFITLQGRVVSLCERHFELAYDAKCRVGVTAPKRHKR